VKERPRFRGVILLIVVLLVGCQPQAKPTSLPTATPLAPASPAPPPTLTPTLASSPTPQPTPTDAPTLTPSWPPPLTPSYTPTGDAATGRIRGRLFFPSEFIPALTVYAVATDGSRFYQVNTEVVPPGKPHYEIVGIEPGDYYVYGYPAAEEPGFGGAYSYLAACDAGHFSPLPEDCWADSQHDLAPVEVRAGQAVEQINIFDWYGPSLPPPPDETDG
jgi:hypothetical protein